MNLNKLKQEAREMYVTPLVINMSWINKPDYHKTLEQLSDTLIDHIATTITDEMTHEWNKAEQRLDGTAQGAVNAIDQFRNYLTTNQ